MSATGARSGLAPDRRPTAHFYPGKRHTRRLIPSAIMGVMTEPAGESSPTSASRPALGGSSTRPAGLTTGPGHRVVHGNPAFVRIFGQRSVSLPAREGMIGPPAEAFALLDTVLRTGRPAARWVVMDGRSWRLTVIPRADPATGEIYGLAFHFRERFDMPVHAPT